MPQRSAEDNPLMNKERDLLPWILGGVSTAAVALAIAAVSNHRAATPNLQATPAIAVAAQPAPAPTLALPSPAAAVPPTPAWPPAAPPTTAANLSAGAQSDSSAATVGKAEGQPEGGAGQIWACTNKGVKTFSNNPCGEKSSLVEVGPINTMNPAAPVHYARAYPTQPQYTTPYNDNAAQYADEEPDQDGYESSGNSYVIVQGVAVLPRRRPEHHPHRPPYHHSPAPAPRKF